MKQNVKVIHHAAQQYFNGYLVYLVSLLLVLFICYVSTHYEPAEKLLPLFFVEWTLVVFIFYLLCPWLGQKGVLISVGLFLLSFCVSAIVVRESIAVHGAVWSWSDDWWYLKEAGNVLDLLRSSNWNLYDSWLEFISSISARWTLAGWPFLLGLISSFITTKGSFELFHAVALSLNATFLTIVIALIYNLIHAPAKQFPGMVFICFILLVGDPIVYAGFSLKETMLQLSLMLAFVFCEKVVGRRGVLWVILGGLGMIGVITTRVAYVPLILFILFWNVSAKIRVSKFLRVMLGIVIIASFAGFILSFQIRGTAVAEPLSGNRLVAEPGLAMSIYNIPVMGPVLFYAISPVPPLPWKILSVKQPAIALIRGAGSVAWFLAACYVLRGIARKRQLLKDGLLFTAAIMLVGCFVGVVLTGGDPRYKQPTNFYLAIMLFLTWYDRRETRRLERLQKDSNV